MSVKSFVVSRVTKRLTSSSRVEKNRANAEARRRKERAPHMIDYFHQVDDPYAHLLVQVLPALAERYDVKIAFHLVGPPPDWAAPDRDRLIAYSRRDAAVLARKAGLTFEDPGHQPDPVQCERAESAITALIDGQQAVARAADISRALWSGDVPTTPSADRTRVDAVKVDSMARREAGGHYLGATLHYGGEWYWGVDRLHYLEARLRGLGAGRDGAPDSLIFPPPDTAIAAPDDPAGQGASAASGPTGTELHAYLSFRSPYTYLAMERLTALADRYGATLKPRIILPMVMRGLEVPRAKGRYILFDAAREARRLGIPFGTICDPVGKPVERGYALFPLAQANGKATAFCASFLRGVWSEGIDAGTDGGLRTIAERAGIDWAAAKAELRNEDWRRIEAENQQELLDLGIWGVPSARVGSVSAWGQDRLWVIEDALKAATAADELTGPAP